MNTTVSILHPENLQLLRLNGGHIQRYLEQRATDMIQLTKGLTDRPLSVVIRTRNNEAHLPSLLNDIYQQIYDAPVEIIIVDTESSDKTLDYAATVGAKIIPIKQADFSYPKALNLGYQAATSPYIMSIVGHSNLSSRYMFKALTYWSHQQNFGGIYNFYVPNWDHSMSEVVAASVYATRYLKPFVENKPHMGLLGANASVVDASVWKRFGGYDERFAAGGEDSELGRQMLNEGYLVAREPLLMIYHSHALGPINTVKQFLYWSKISKPYNFDVTALRRYGRKI